MYIGLTHAVKAMWRLTVDLCYKKRNRGKSRKDCNEREGVRVALLTAAVGHEAGPSTGVALQRRQHHTPAGLT